MKSPRIAELPPWYGQLHFGSLNHTLSQLFFVRKTYTITLCILATKKLNRTIRHYIEHYMQTTLVVSVSSVTWMRKQVLSFFACSFVDFSLV